ncbi:hypothetical protein P5V15_014834 [Pogonomyrmex californicus]
MPDDTTMILMMRSRRVLKLREDLRSLCPSLAIRPLLLTPAFSRDVPAELSFLAPMDLLVMVLRMLLTLLNCRLSDGDETPHPSTRILSTRSSHGCELFDFGSSLCFFLVPPQFAILPHARNVAGTSLLHTPSLSFSLSPSLFLSLPLFLTLFLPLLILNIVFFLFRNACKNVS